MIIILELFALVQDTLILMIQMLLEYLKRYNCIKRLGTALDGMMRYNTTSNVFELYSGGFWNAVGGSVSGVVDPRSSTLNSADVNSWCR